MINLKITVQPKSIKCLEFKQTLDTIKNDLQKYCTHLTVIEKENTFSLVADLNSDEQLSEIIKSKEIGILSGAIKMLGEKSKTTVNGSNIKNGTTNFKRLRLKYLKNNK